GNEGKLEEPREVGLRHLDVDHLRGAGRVLDRVVRRRPSDLEGLTVDPRGDAPLVGSADLIVEPDKLSGVAGVLARLVLDGDSGGARIAEAAVEQASTREG